MEELLELKTYIEQGNYSEALTFEAFEGRYDEVELAQTFDIEQVKHEAMELIQQKREQ